MNNLCLIFCVCFFLSIPALSYAVDFLIAEQPDRLRILNKYEQNLSPAEAAIFTDYCPLMITDEHVLLSDAYSTAIKIEFSKKVFYLIKDSRGAPATKGENSNNIKRYRNVSALHDTIVINRDNYFRFFPPESRDDTTLYLDKGQKVERIFYSRGTTYVRLLGISSRFGWVDLSDTRHWQKYIPSDSRFIPNPLLIRQKLSKRIIQVNSIYSSLFNELNRKLHADEIAPHWQLKESGDKMILSFTPKHYQSSFKKSIIRFLNEVDRMIQQYELIRQPTVVALEFEIKHEKSK